MGGGRIRTRVWLVVGFLLFSCGCASPSPGLWPPEPGAPAHSIIVSVDTWHAVIALPEESGPFTSDVSRSHGLYEEWGYAEKGWYLEDRRGLTGILRVLFRSTPGVVEVGRHDKVWAERTDQPPSEQFLFHLSDEGYRRLRRHLEDSLASRRPVLTRADEVYYPSVRSYNLLVNQCHHYAARALREAGLPVSVFWALTPAAFVAQLERAIRLQEEFEAERRQTGARP